MSFSRIPRARSLYHADSDESEACNPAEAPAGYRAVLKRTLRNNGKNICRQCDWRPQCNDPATDLLVRKVRAASTKSPVIAPLLALLKKGEFEYSDDMSKPKDLLEADGDVWAPSKSNSFRWAKLRRDLSSEELAELTARDSVEFGIETNLRREDSNDFSRWILPVTLKIDAALCKLGAEALRLNQKYEKAAADRDALSKQLKDLPNTVESMKPAIARRSLEASAEGTKMLEMVDQAIKAHLTGDPTKLLP